MTVSESVRRAEMLLCATRLVALGGKLFPCGPDKAPLTKGGFKAATADIDAIRRYLSKAQLPMLGMATGQKSGIFVMDFDVDAGKNVDGTLWWAANEKQFGLGHPHAIARTPRGGEHHYFRYPANQKIGCSAGKLAPGVDVRGDGGYVIVPPSSSPVGLYSWVVSPWEISNVD